MRYSRFCGNWRRRRPSSAIETLVLNGDDRSLCRINALDFAAKNALDDEETIAGFLHAARLGLFELAWNVLCPGCGGVLDTGATLKTIDQDELFLRALRGRLRADAR